MGIVILKNQPIDFNVASDDPDCGCAGKAFCQIIDPTDATQFQIASYDEVVNGDFISGGEGWDDTIPLDLVIEITNISSEGECDGSVTITPTNGNAPYAYSLNGGAFQEENSFLDLCEGCYYVTVKDSLGLEESAEFCIEANIDCGAYDMTDELLPFTTAQLLNCLTSDFI